MKSFSIPGLFNYSLAPPKKRFLIEKCAYDETIQGIVRRYKDFMVSRVFQVCSVVPGCISLSHHMTGK